MKVGDRLEEYNIVRLIGAGGFGEVYLAHDTNLDRPVAIKELYSAAALNDIAVNRFKQEARTVGNLNHPHIVTVYNLKAKGGALYLIMEYLSGGSLRDRLNREGKLQAELALKIGIDVCDALAAVHAKGIVHRDIKPENILFTEDGRAKVTDFGIAHVPRSAGGTSMTRTGFQPGTMMYMSPEQARGAQLTGESDVYQVGVLLFEMLTGRHYFDPDDLLRQAMREMEGTNPDAPAVQARWMLLVAEKIGVPPDFDAHVPPELARLINTAMASRADYRPDAFELRRALTACVSAEAKPIRPRLRGSARSDVLGTPVQESVGSSVLLTELDRLRDARDEALDEDRELDSRVLTRIMGDLEVQIREANRGWFDVETSEQGPFLRDGSPDRTIADYTRAIELLPDLSWAWGGRSWACAHGKASDRAIADATQAIKLQPNLPLYWSNRGYLNLVSGRPDGAIDDFDKAVSLDPGFYLAWAGLGLAGDVAGLNLPTSIDNYTRAIELQPDIAWVWSCRGHLYLRERDPERANADFTRAVQLRPDNAWYWMDCGNLHRKRRNLNRAGTDYTNAIFHDRNISAAWSGRGEVFRETGYLDEAIRDCTHAIELAPHNIEAWASRGLARLAKGDPDGAFDDCNRATELGPNALAYFGRAEVYRAKGDLDRAIADYGVVFMIDQSSIWSAVVWAGRGSARSAKGELEGAIADFTQAIELDSSLAPAWLGRGEAYQIKGDLDRATADLTRAIELDPGSARARKARDSALVQKDGS